MLKASCTRCLKHFVRRPVPLPTSTPPASHRFASSAASSSPPSSSPSTGEDEHSSLPKRSKTPRSRPTPHSQQRTLPPTPYQVREQLRHLLATKKPRQALQEHIRTLDVVQENTAEEALCAQAHLFLDYRQPSIAFEAIKALHERGYAVRPLLAAELLDALSTGLEGDQETIVQVLGWFSDGILKGKQDGKDADVQLMQTVFSVLSRIGRSDWTDELFRLYRETLREGEIGSTRLWTAVISANLQVFEVKWARELFETWRALQRRKRTNNGESFQPSSPSANSPPHPPPPGPYLALLNHFANHSPNLPSSRDPAYLFLQEIQKDGLAPSTALLNSLLRLELRRSRFSSFWGIWEQFTARSLPRNAISWSLAIQAVLSAESVRLKRQRGRKHNSPLLSSSPFAYTEVHTPSSRALFRALLVDHLARTDHRPSRLIPTPSTGTRTDLVSPSLLNSFLDLFVARSDWNACVVVLETFAVHRLEPDARTHGSVVVGVVKQWERGRLQGRLRKEENALARYNALGGYGEIEENRSRRNPLGGPDSLAMIRTILEGRKVRAGLWQTEPRADIEESGDDLAARLANPPALQEERRSEMRYTRYLVSLLKRCAGLEGEKWGAALAETRKEMLPEKREKTRR
ncbi:hypothetical protein JCM11251_001338 [Rhodosporidiobolus azoricus]